MLGCVRVPFARCIEAHSDGDVIVHAACDAMLGAAALGDIGVHFPDSDPAFAGASGERLLNATYEKVRSLGYTLGNLDVTLVAEQPKVRAHVDAMRAAMAGVLEVDVESISIKATTTEKLGAIGRGEGLAAQAVVLLE